MMTESERVIDAQRNGECITGVDHGPQPQPLPPRRLNRHARRTADALFRPEAKRIRKTAERLCRMIALDNLGRALMLAACSLPKSKSPDPPESA